MSSAQNRPESELVSLADEEAVKEVLSNTIMGLWELVNNLTRLRPSRRDRYRVAIFGSARASPARSCTTRSSAPPPPLPRMGCDIVTGGGPGLMQAANEGATSAGGDVESMGIRVELPFEQDVNPFVAQAFEHRTFFTRLQHFVHRLRRLHRRARRHRHRPGDAHDLAAPAGPARRTTCR